MKCTEQLFRLYSLLFMLLLAACNNDGDDSPAPPQKAGEKTKFKSIEEARKTGQDAMTYTFASLESFAGDDFYDLYDFNTEISSRMNAPIRDEAGTIQSKEYAETMLFDKMLELGKNFVVHERVSDSIFDVQRNIALISFDILPGTYTVSSKNPTVVTYEANTANVEIILDLTTLNDDMLNKNTYKLVYKDPESKFRIFGEKVAVYESSDQSYSAHSYRLFYGYDKGSFENPPLFKGELVIYKDGVEEVKCLANISGEYEFSKSEGLKRNLSRYEMMVYKRGESLVKELYEPATHTYQTSLYDDNGNPTEFAFKFSLLETGAYRQYNLDNLFLYKNIIPFMLVRERLFIFFLSVVLLENEGVEEAEGFKIEADITKDNNEINYVFDYSGLSEYPAYSTEEEEIKNINASDLIIGGFVKIDGELVFTLMREGNILYADYEYEKTRVNAEDYIKQYFQPLEDAMENTYAERNLD